MKRNAINILTSWKIKENRKPMLIYGARQVGKTWIMREFGKTAYNDYIYINLERNKLEFDLFTQDLDTSRIIKGIEIIAKKQITHDTLIIIDEIQANPNAITSLKYFCEEKPDLHIIAAGSLLGVTLHDGVSYPVGKVDTMSLYPLNFYEFLLAIGEKQLAQLIISNDFEMVNIFNDKLTQYLKEYMYIGGMPEVVQNYVNNRDFYKVREIQLEILDAYHKDLSKHVPKNILPKVNIVWDAIVAQLSKDNKKFIYSEIQKGSRAKDYENAIEWLKNAGLIYTVNDISKPFLPIKSYYKNGFKIFMLDVGLLSATAGITAKTILDNNKLFVEFKGAIAEQYVLQELKTITNIDIGYWTSNATAEVDFLVQIMDKVIPLEVKSSINLRSKSLHTYIDKYKPDIAVRSSLSSYKVTQNIYDVPLSIIGNLMLIIYD